MFFAASRRNYPLPPTASQEEGPAEDRQFHPAPLARASSQPIAWEPLRVSVAGRAAVTPLPYRQQPRLCRPVQPHLAQGTGTRQSYARWAGGAWLDPELV